MFKRPKQNRIFQDLVKQIENAVLEGVLNPGDRLPPERDLQEMFSTSRGSLREALRVLEEKGLIEVRPGVGGGAVVKTPGTELVSESLGFLIRHQRVSLNHLAEFREGVEGMVVSLAAQRATPDDITHLQALLADAQTHLDGGLDHLDEFLNADKKLHMSLAAIAGNPVYESVLKSVHENIHRYYDRFLPKEPSVLRQNFQDLRYIVQAVADHRVEEAGNLARRHIRRFNGYMQRSFTQQKGA